LSNNATICSYPRFLHDNPYPLELGYPELDALTAAVNHGFEVEAPTAVGFCTYIKRACLDAVGLFDEKTFGKGYGEENDFCQRAIAKGWRNVIAGDVFVYHRGSTSFQGEKAKRVHVAMAILDKLYPAYHRDVAGFIEQDSLREGRQRLDWARLQRQSRERNVLIVVHGRGGGTERHVQDDIQVLSREGFGVYLLRPVPGNPTHVALSHPATKALPNLPPFAISDVQQLTGVLRELRITDVHTHSLIDAVPDAPKHVAELIKALGAKWEVNLHDYKVICPRINLADAAGRYCGEPDQPACNKCLAENDSLFGQPDIGEWREMHRHALLAADQVLVPDQDMAQRLQRYFPEVQFEVSPHEDIDAQGVELTVPRLGRDEPLHVVVVGAISYVKGFDVFLACAQDAQRRRLPLRFTLMGYSVNDGLLGKAGVQVTGRYLEHAALEQLRAIDPHVVWLPALWPETYSYTLSLALLLGRPIFAFDIGAIAARLRRLEMTDLLAPLALADAPEALNSLLLERRARWSAADD
jgi:glycosyltransferase involved in cell wall biosynthesis